MLWEALAYAAVGLSVAFAATRLLPRRRLPAATLVLATGTVAAVLGGLVTRTVLGSDRFLISLAVSVGVAAALLSLLVRPPRAARRSAPRAA
ncbi:hypothetical protein [Actinacidiphila sp. bgisy167]|uniref:hypothetical protein n=1 Tax=Actinacidiphila sp. bgisy167 TaxID=3413797 RepID=UPI003D765699